jgi:hypothetical protein
MATSLHSDLDGFGIHQNFNREGYHFNPTKEMEKCHKLQPFYQCPIHLHHCFKPDPAQTF